jgi:hypothetical protein
MVTLAAGADADSPKLRLERVLQPKQSHFMKLSDRSDLLGTFAQIARMRESDSGAVQK